MFRIIIILMMRFLPISPSSFFTIASAAVSTAPHIGTHCCVRICTRFSVNWLRLCRRLLIGLCFDLRCNIAAVDGELMAAPSCSRSNNVVCCQQLHVICLLLLLLLSFCSDSVSAARSLRYIISSAGIAPRFDVINISIYK